MSKRALFEIKHPRAARLVRTQSGKYGVQVRRRILGSWVFVSKTSEFSWRNPKNIREQCLFDNYQDAKNFFDSMSPRHLNISNDGVLEEQKL